MRRFVVFPLHALLFGLMFFVGASFASGQIIGTESASLTVNPATPAPFSEAEVSLNAYSVNTVGASIRWFVDGREVTDARDERSLLLQTGDIGDTVNVEASVTLVNGNSFSVSRSITPTVVDLIIEADTLTPTFYKGRALPVQGEPLTVVALLQDGSGRDPSTYSYEWTLATKVLFGGPVKGKYRIDTTMGQYRDVLSVRIYNSDGTILGSTAITLVPVDAEVLFYEENPLRGLSTRAIQGAHPLIGEETTVRAEPYFMAADIFGSSPRLTWSIDGREVITPNLDPASITLERQGGSGAAHIFFSVANPDEPLQFTSGSFNLFFE